MTLQRAARNRTITLSPDDRRSLAPMLSTATRPMEAVEVDGRVFNQDLLEVIDLMPERFADLIILDPPYNLTKVYDGVTFARRGDDDYVDYLLQWMPRVMRCLKPSGSVYACCDWRSSAAVAQTLSQYATIKNRITWQREKGRGARSNWKNAMEDIWYAVGDEGDYYFDVDAVKVKRRVLAPYRQDGKPKDWEATAEGNFRLTHPSNFWDDISVPYWSMPENTDHPTQKPEKLVAKLILASCPPGGMVFDPFLGSGTSAVVAKKLGRRWCGIELSMEYALLAAKRLAMADSDPTIQGYADGVFWERNSACRRSRAGK